MRKGENIFKRKDGRWEARYRKGRDENGKIRYGYCYGKTYSEAKSKAEQAKAGHFEECAPQIRGGPTFAVYCDAWLYRKQPQLHRSSYAKYETILKKHIKPALGHFAPEELSDQIVQAFSRKLLYEKGLSPKTVKDILLVLHGILAYTPKNYSGQMQAVEIIYPKETKKAIRVLSMDEQQRFTQYLLCDINLCKMGILLTLWTGLRIGELCALRRSHIHFADQVLVVEATAQRVKNERPEGTAKTEVIIGPAKSTSSVRTIPLTRGILSVCEPLLREMENDPYILTGTSRCMEPRMIQNRFQNYVKECGLQEIHFHTLRHTFATRSIEAGMDVKTLSELLGHANATITMNRYVHCSMDMKRRNMEKLSSFQGI